MDDTGAPDGKERDDSKQADDPAVADGQDAV